MIIAEILWTQVKWVKQILVNISEHVDQIALEQLVAIKAPGT